MMPRPRLTTNRALAAAALLLGALALAADRAAPPLDAAAIAAEIEHEADHVTALQLARWIRDGRPGLAVVDLRGDSAVRDLAIPGAVSLPLEQLVRRPHPPGETLVLVSDNGTHAAQAWVLLRAGGARGVYVLRDGMLAWVEDILQARIPSDASSAERDAFRERAELSRWFGGVPRVVPPGEAPALGPGSAVPLPPGAAAVQRLRRRGC